MGPNGKVNSVKRTNHVLTISFKVNVPLTLLFVDVIFDLPSVFQLSVALFERDKAVCNLHVDEFFFY